MRYYCAAQTSKKVDGCNQVCTPQRLKFSPCRTLGGRGGSGSLFHLQLSGSNSNLVHNPKQTSFLLVFWRKIYFYASFTFRSLAGFCLKNNAYVGKHAFFFFLFFLKSCLQLWLGGSFTLNLRSVLPWGEWADTTQLVCRVRVTKLIPAVLLLAIRGLGWQRCITCT